MFWSKLAIDRLRNERRETLQGSEQVESSVHLNIIYKSGTERIKNH